MEEAILGTFVIGSFCSGIFTIGCCVPPPEFIGIIWGAGSESCAGSCNFGGGAWTFSELALTWALFDLATKFISSCAICWTSALVSPTCKFSVALFVIIPDLGSTCATAGGITLDAGKGISLDSNLNISSESINGLFSVENRNYKNTDKSLFFTVDASETDRLKNSGYKFNRTGFDVGTRFEYYDDFYLKLGSSNYYERIETDNTASARQQAQEGDYLDLFLNLSATYDKRNQKFQTSDGFLSSYSVDLPYISETYSLINKYKYKYFTELYENNVSSFSLSLRSAHSLKNEDIKLSERLRIPSSLLRGFEFGKVGPKDGDDYIGGNYMVAVNFSSTLPQVLENSQNTDFLIFVDAANLWGVDYNSSLDDNEIRSSIGIALDWFSPVGPMNFSLAQPLTKSDNDVTESFRFNLGTTF